MKITAVILAAGQGTRMRSTLPKVLHPLLGRSLIWYTVETTREVTGEKPVVVIGHGAEPVHQALGEAAQLILQEAQLGTGHALMQAEGLLQGKSDIILVIAADMPLLTRATLERLVEAHAAPAGKGEKTPAITLPLFPTMRVFLGGSSAMQMERCRRLSKKHKPRQNSSACES